MTAVIGQRCVIT